MHLQVSGVEPKVTRGSETRISLPTETEETVPEVTVGRECLPPQTPAPEIVQQEWTCAMCNVKVHNETTFMYHLQGKKHKAKEEAEKAKSQPCPPKIMPTKKPNKSTEEPGNSLKNQTVFPKVPQTPAPETVQKEWTCAMCNVKAQSFTTFMFHLQGKKHKANTNDHQ